MRRYAGCAGQLFKLYDIDNSGKLDKGELTDVLRDMGKTEKEISRHLAIIKNDNNKGGKADEIDFEYFRDVLVRTSDQVDGAAHSSFHAGNALPTSCNPCSSLACIRRHMRTHTPARMRPHTRHPYMVHGTVHSACMCIQYVYTHACTHMRARACTHAHGCTRIMHAHS